MSERAEIAILAFCMGVIVTCVLALLVVALATYPHAAR